ncbi:MAG: porphobilinogen synthase [Balneolales bacterium]
MALPNQHFPSGFPRVRGRRNRYRKSRRDMVAEHRLSPSDFIAPMFISEGKKLKEPIPSMPEYYRFSPDMAVKQAVYWYELGIPAILLFVKVPEKKKDNRGAEALNERGLMPLAVKLIKEAVPELTVMTDVALDPYSSYGHDGIVYEGEILNDQTVEVLVKMAVSHARAGTDYVAPSDMMDGRIGEIRRALEAEGLPNTGILAYSAKYASVFYGPFRDALDSLPGFGDKKTYQMDPANVREAVREAQMDEAEGADMVMVKPGLPYLDVVRAVRESVQVPVVVYNVSGEYAMIKAAAEKGWLDEEQAMMESLLACKRAGANLIATYWAEKAVKLLQK